MIHDGRSRKLPSIADEALTHLRARDPKLGALIDRVGAFTLRLDPWPSPFESLLESILYQQLARQGGGYHSSSRAGVLRRRPFAAGHA